MDRESIVKKLEYQASVMTAANVPVENWFLYRDQVVGILQATNFDTEDKIDEFVRNLINHPVPIVDCSDDVEDAAKQILWEV